NKLAEDKESIKQFFTPFMRNESQLDVVANPAAYFLCTSVQMTEYVWETVTYDYTSGEETESDEDEGEVVEEDEDEDEAEVEAEEDEDEMYN
ncbi:hypothetical protein LTR53_011774, partial [Teratosphaeriaceae sp. CCFEE 6253]